MLPVQSIASAHPALPADGQPIDIPPITASHTEADAGKYFLSLFPRSLTSRLWCCPAGMRWAAAGLPTPPGSARMWSRSWLNGAGLSSVPAHRFPTTAWSLSSLLYGDRCNHAIQGQLFFRSLWGAGGAR